MRLALVCVGKLKAGPERLLFERYFKRLSEGARGAGFTGVEMQARPEWHDTYTRVYQVALSLGDPGDDALLADLQDEARQQLPLAGLQDRVVVIATAP